MQKEIIIKRLQEIIQAPDTTAEDKLILEEICRLLHSQTLENIYKAIELLAGIAGIATYIQHMT